MPSLVASVAKHAAAAPESAALRGPGGIITYRDLARRALEYGAMLRAWGIAPGDRIVFIAPSVDEFVIAYLGIQAVGATVVPVNPLCTASELQYFIEDSESRLIIAWEGLDAAARVAAGETGIDFLALGPGAPTEGVEPLEGPEDRADDDVAAILYTSGTTGRPKGAELTVGNLDAAARIAGQLSQSTAQDRLGTALPLFHVFGQASVMLAALRSGCSLTLVTPFTATGLIDAVVREELTILSGVPTMWNAMLHAAPDTPAEAFARLRLAVSGGASLAPEINEAFQRRFGCLISEGYGLTETTAIATFSMPGVPAPTGTVGPAAPEMEIRLGAPDTPEVPVGERGEVYVRGPVVMRGYRGRPEATAETVIDGWLRTGDIGEIDAEGNLRIVDRAKELIIRGGYNVYPSEVEHVLYAHPDVVEVAVLGIPDEHLGEEIAAVIALRPGAVADSAAIRAYGAERLAAYKHPRVVHFVDALPKGASGKILKRAIEKDPLVAALADYRASRRG
ncbi:AMP-binding protein [Tsukamurella sp. 1534]|uniref:AMP-binding protein n=1 Tax=Tsukamurella sp. 1534 TaxID=1151061 RepID=UPI0002FD7870|nr:AMP-binding protein [Tsukamurella sp. 1534]